jgi:predicted RNase H-like HicB family nuclease
MSKLHYLAILERSESNGYGVYFPDLPGCVTVGDTEGEAWASAESVLNLHIAGMIEDGELLPAPSLPSAVKPDPEVDEVARLLIAVAADPPKVRINVMLDANVLQAIDMVSDNRSQFLTDAATAMLRLGTPPRARPRRVRGYRAA